jgi:hypothetical protein
MASCRITKECPGGKLTAKTVGLGKEIKDLTLCTVLVFPTEYRIKKCRGAFQPTDPKDNLLGYSCPEHLTCRERCYSLENLPEPPPGPFKALRELDPLLLF